MALADVDGCFMHSHVLGVRICETIIYFLSIRIPIYFFIHFLDVNLIHIFHFFTAKYTTHTMYHNTIAGSFLNNNRS